MKPLIYHLYPHYIPSLCQEQAAEGSEHEWALWVKGPGLSRAGTWDNVITALTEGSFNAGAPHRQMHMSGLAKPKNNSDMIKEVTVKLSLEGWVEVAR